jgi:hypothetical protein
MGGEQLADAHRRNCGEAQIRLDSEENRGTSPDTVMILRLSAG